MARLYPNENTSPPQFDSPVPGVESVCGAKYYDEIIVRAPYMNTNRHARKLTAYPVEITFGNKPPSMDSPEFDKQLKYALEKSTLNLIDEVINDAYDMLTEYVTGGFIDSKNITAIDNLISEARSQITKAKKIDNHWRNYWISPQVTKGWPLENQWLNDNCENRFAPDTYEAFTMTPQGAKMTEQTCPAESVYWDHQKDRLLYVDLVRGALLRARCAQEAAAAVGTYHRNKKEYEKEMKVSAATRLQMRGGSSSGTLEPPLDASGLVGLIPGDAEPPPADGADDGFPFPGYPGEPPGMGGGLEEDDEGLPEPDDEDITSADGDSSTSKSKKSKKKGGGSGLLIAGAAVLGLLAFGGKK